mmetsp:Transcript_116309/g.290399  ORF Transcript_116309/g.290399 Transcript_116309/m.290399 type:complete len:98 (-) Transcript_116309:3674-3967(-)
MSSSCLPDSTTTPARTTRMRSESRMVLSRCAIVKVVRFSRALSKAAWTTRSDVESSADVASSSNNTLGSLSNALAIAQRCFCPPLSLPPLVPTMSPH